MRLERLSTRALMIVMATAVAAASLASPAAADRRVRYKGWGGPRVVRTVAVSPAPGPVYWSSSSYGAPSFASFVGGVIIGTAIAAAVQPHAVVYATPPPPVCAVPPPVPCDYYFDPYCDQRFTTLDDYGQHLAFEHHPPIVRVIDGASGRCIGEEVWHDGRWCHRGDWDGDDRWSDRR